MAPKTLIAAFGALGTYILMRDKHAVDLAKKDEEIRQLKLAEEATWKRANEWAETNRSERLEITRNSVISNRELEEHKEKIRSLESTIEFMAFTGISAATIAFLKVITGRVV
jgi:hypothetical protein